MKAKDWEFEKFIPDLEDVDAEDKAHFNYFIESNLSYLNKMNESEERMHIFRLAFVRGCAWMKAKHDIT